MNKKETIKGTYSGHIDCHERIIDAAGLEIMAIASVDFDAEAFGLKTGDKVKITIEKAKA